MTTLQQHLEQLHQQYDIVAVIDLDPWHDLEPHQRKPWFRDALAPVYRSAYENNQRVVFTLTRGDVYQDPGAEAGYILDHLQRRLNESDISNFFVILLTTDQTQADCYPAVLARSTDPVPITVQVCGNEPAIKRCAYNYHSTDPVKVNIQDLDHDQALLLTQSRTFCMYPWIHFHAYPTGQAYPCCMSDMEFPVGNMRTHTIREIWNNTKMREMRRAMLAEQPLDACTRCYEQEAAGFMSGRRSANKHHGHHVNRVQATQPDGTLDQFELTYWDIRFSNLCNLKCRSCGHIFSSQWYQDQARLAGPEWKLHNSVLNYAGRSETDAWDQLLEHIDYVEQIYFAGGEPLLMEEHYRILEELVRRGRTDVRLIYNTNFTHTDLKGKSVFEYWRQFDSVAVGASLDGHGKPAEYIRKGTAWADVIQNRLDMIRICPQVDFYISPTLSILNAAHLPGFHREWVAAGLIKPQDLNVNILQDPPYYRIDIAPQAYKEQLTELYREHINWLKLVGDPLGRATQGFESAITFLNATDNTHLIDTFWRKTHELDSIRNESWSNILPELKALK